MESCLLKWPAVNNHAELMELWDCLLTEEGREQLLRQTDNLGRTLQDSSTSAAQGNRLAQDVVKNLTETQCIATRFEQEDFKI